ncbi:MAG: CoB--CoM heterodisulfide reductase iron-sulfur subunit A family protein [Elusimicrobia bacterium]|nr:CoB--CoM heterodisulfide reductase iron-sulfur subunit A family protein [Elusimicrobiota bacterium]
MKIGVFVCHCGTNISAVIDVQKVVNDLAKMPGVFAMDYKFMCSDPGQNMIISEIKQKKLDAVIVAACSPCLHELTFRNTLIRGGLNPYMLEIANIREQDSWVHTDRDKATEKAVRLAKMAVAKAKRNQPLFPQEVSVEKSCLVIGGGIAGIQAAIDISSAGYQTVIVEKEPSIGGKMAMFDKTFPTLDCSACILTPKMVQASQSKKVKIYTYSEVEEIGGYVGNFNARIRVKARSVNMEKCTGCGICWQKCPVKVNSEFEQNLGPRKAVYVPFAQAVPNVPVIDCVNCTYYRSKRQNPESKGLCRICEKFCPAGAIEFDQKDKIIEEKFGAVIVATGFSAFDHKVYGEYGAGRYKDVVTALQFERLLNSSGPTQGKILRPSDSKEARTIVFVQCVGSRDESKGVPYCSRVCCMYTAKQALLLKEHIPDANAYVFYIDIRAAGKNYEEFIERVQDEYGVLYLRGRVSKIYRTGDGALLVRGADTLSGTQVEISADMVVLATGLVSNPETVKLGQMIGIPYDKNRFFTESHPKLAPAETQTAGVFICGACQFPKDIPDSVAQAGAAASKVLGLFSQEHLMLEPVLACVNQKICNGCFHCRAVCPYNAIDEEILKDKSVVARVIESKCHGCGNCISACPVSAVDLKGYTNEQILEQLQSLR